MASRTKGILGILVGCGLLAGCGLHMFATREPWRSQAEEECLAQKGIQPTTYTEPVPAISGPAACGIDHPFRVSALGNGAIALTGHPVLGCPIINTVDHWLAESVQPAAQRAFGQPVIEVRQIAAYGCRTRNNQYTSRVSEHAFGNAIDIAAFTLADGRKITIQNGWRGETDEQAFLAEVFEAACQRFSTILGPGSNAFHYDHIHLDLARHGGSRPVVCNATPNVAALQKHDRMMTGSIGSRSQRADNARGGTRADALPGDD
jgi:hypothetical protein